MAPPPPTSDWEIPNTTVPDVDESAYGYGSYDSAYRSGANLGSQSYSSSMNPASTFSFMLNMGYPPPPMALEGLRRTLENLTSGTTPALNLQIAMRIVDDIHRSPYRVSQAVLFVTQQRLHSSKPDRVYLSLELVDVCVKNCGLDFARHINKEYMKSLTMLLKTTSFKDRTITGQVKKLEKFLTGSSSSAVGVATDPRIHKIKRKVLYLVQSWVDAFMMSPHDIQAILESYKSLRRKGVQFPPSDASNRYLIKHAEASPAFTGGPAPPNAATAAAAPSSISSDGMSSTCPEGDFPLSDKQYVQLERMVGILRTSDSADIIERCITICDKLGPKLDEASKTASFNISHQKSSKLKGSDPNVLQLNVILDLDAEIKKRRGYGVLNMSQKRHVDAVPKSSSSSTATTVSAQPSAFQQQTRSYVQDLLEDPQLAMTNRTTPAAEDHSNHRKTVVVPQTSKDTMFGSDEFNVHDEPEELWTFSSPGGVPTIQRPSVTSEKLTDDFFSQSNIWDDPQPPSPPSVVTTKVSPPQQSSEPKSTNVKFQRNYDALNEISLLDLSSSSTSQTPAQPEAGGGTTASLSTAWPSATDEPHQPVSSDRLCSVSDEPPIMHSAKGSLDGDTSSDERVIEVEHRQDAEVTRRRNSSTYLSSADSSEDYPCSLGLVSSESNIIPPVEEQISLEEKALEQESQKDGGSQVTQSSMPVGETGKVAAKPSAQQGSHESINFDDMFFGGMASFKNDDDAGQLAYFNDIADIDTLT